MPDDRVKSPDQPLRNLPEPDDLAERARHIHVLREQVGLTLNREFLSVADDLEQLRGLLSDAAARLSSAFQEMRNASDDIASLVRNGSRPGETPAVEEVVAAAARIAGNAGSTVQTLQFEDMASQLLAYVRRRLDLVEAFSKDMAALSLDTVKTPLHDEALSRLQNVVECYQLEMSAMRRKAIQQESLDAGAIELF